MTNNLPAIFEVRESSVFPRNIFLHFVDHEFLSLTSLDKAFSNSVLERMRGAMIVALLIADKYVYMPAAAYFESDYARNLFNMFPQFRQYGFLRLIGSAYGVGDFVDGKRPQYAKDRNRYPRYFNDREMRQLSSTDTNWLRRQSSASRDISTGWILSVNMQERIWDSLAHRHGLSSVARLEKNLLALPERLGESAFIADFVLPLLQLPASSPLDINVINAFITQQYNNSYLKELDACCLVELPFADSASVLREFSGHVSYSSLLQLWGRLGIDHFLLNASDSELIRIRNTEVWLDFIRQFCWPYSLLNNKKLIEGRNGRRMHLKNSFNDPVNDSDGVINRIETLLESNGISEELEKSSVRSFMVNPHSTKKPTMFIVHGHDDKTKLEVKNYLQNVLLLPEPIILHERPSLGRSIIEKFEANASSVDGAIILLTPDDLWIKDGTNDEIRRARQNVIFELGYLYAKFGRKSGRVLLLYKGKLDIPSDINGIIYVDISNGVESAGEQIRRELIWIN